MFLTFWGGARYLKVELIKRMTLFWEEVFLISSSKFDCVETLQMFTNEKHKNHLTTAIIFNLLLLPPFFSTTFWDFQAWKVQEWIKFSNLELKTKKKIYIWKFKHNFQFSSHSRHIRRFYQHAVHTLKVSSSKILTRIPSCTWEM